MVIDSHQHFWEYRPERLPWITTEMTRLRRDFLPKDLMPILQENGVDGCVAVQAEMTERETEFLLQCAQSWPRIRGVVGWVNLCSPAVADRLDTLCRNPLLKGIRHIVQDEPDDHFMLRQDFRHGIAQLSSRGLTYDILVYPRQLPAAISLVKHFPDQVFVLDHIGKPVIGAQMDPDWKKAVSKLASYDNVLCKLSGLVTETPGFLWKKDQIFPFLDHVTEVFGPSRLMYGSDWPVCLLAAEYAAVKHIITDYLTALSLEEQAMVMGRNAVRWYGLNAEQSGEKQ